MRSPLGNFAINADRSHHSRTNEREQGSLADFGPGNTHTFAVPIRASFFLCVLSAATADFVSGVSCCFLPLSVEAGQVTLGHECRVCTRSRCLRRC